MNEKKITVVIVGMGFGKDRATGHDQRSIWRRKIRLFHW